VLFWQTQCRRATVCPIFGQLNSPPPESWHPQYPVSVSTQFTGEQPASQGLGSAGHAGPAIGSAS